MIAGSIGGRIEAFSFAANCDFMPEPATPQNCAP